MKDTKNKNTTAKVANTEVNQSKEKPDLRRRKAVLGAATGATLAAWHKPVINSVILPAHAQTSAPPPPPPAAASAFFGANVTPGPTMTSVGESLLNMLVPNAIAGGAAPASMYTVAISSDNADNSSFTVGLFEDLGATQGFDVAQIVYSGTVTTSGGGTLSPSENPCGLEGVENISVEIADVGADSISLNLTNRGQSVIVPAGDGTLPAAMCAGGPVARSFFIQNAGGGIVQESSLLDALIPPAQAAIMPIGNSLFTALAEETAAGSNQFNITVLERQERPASQVYTAVESTFSGSIAGPGSGTLGLETAGCDDAPMDSISAEITSVSDDTLELNLINRETMLTLTPGTIMIDPPMCDMVAVASSYFQPGTAGMMPQMEANSKSILDLFISEAVAGGASPSQFGVSAVQQMGNPQMYDIEVLNPRGDAIRAGSLNIDGTSGTLAFVPPACPGGEGTPVDFTAQILFIDDMSMSLQIIGNRTIVFSVPAGSGTLTAVCDQQPPPP